MLLTRFLRAFIALCLVTQFTAVTPAYAVSTTISANVQVSNDTSGDGTYYTNVTANVGDRVAFLVFLENTGSVTATNLIANFNAFGNGLITPYPNTDWGGTATDSILDAFNDPSGVWRSQTVFDLDQTTGSKNYTVGNVPAGVSAELYYISARIPTNYNQPSFNLTVNASCTNGCTTTGFPTATVNVAVAPTVSNVAFSPTSVTNNGTSTTKITATVSDPSGLGDISAVAANLSSIGGSSSVTLYDNGTNGDTTAGDGVFSRSGITTTAAAGTYGSISVTATDTGGNTGSGTGSLIVASAGAPTVTINSNTRSTLSNVSGYTSTTINWQSSLACGSGGSQGYRIERGGTGTPGSGTQLVGWTPSGCSANTALNSAINVSSLPSDASYPIYIYVKTTDNQVGYNYVTLTRDTTTPTVSVSSTNPSTIYPSQSSTVAWSGSQAGTYEVRIGGSSGTLFSGSNGSGSYAGSGTVSSTGTFANFGEGANTVYVYLTDAGGNVGNTTTTVTKDSTPAVTSVTNLTLADGDVTADSGIDGRDFTVTWTSPTDSNTTTNFNRYDIYLLPAATTFNAGTQTAKASVASVATTSWTGTSAITTDSAGNAFAGGSYRAYVITRGTGGYEDSGTQVSPSATIESETAVPPAFSSAAFVDSTTLKVVFSKNLSTTLTNHVASKFTSSSFTVNTAAGTNGIDSVSGNTIYVKVNALGNTGLSASDLAIAAGAVKSTTNIANLAESGKSIADQQTPSPLTLTTPAASSFITGTFNLAYTLPETMGSASVTFTRTGGSSDTTHAIALTNKNAGSQTQSFNPVGTLVNETIYSVSLSGSDTAGNAGSPATNTSVTYDTIAPSTPATTHYPTAGSGNNAWTTDNTPTLAWATSTDGIAVASYTVQVSTLSNFSVLAYSATVGHPTTSVTTGTLADGAYYWRVLATDTAGNVSAGQSTTEQLRVDTTGPTVALSSATASSTTAILATGGSATDGSGVGATYQYDLIRYNADCSTGGVSSGWQVGTSASFTGLTANTRYCFKIRAQDSLGNIGAYSAGTLRYTLANQVTALAAAGGYDTTNNYKNVLSWTTAGQSGVKIEQDASCNGSYETTVYDNASATPSSPYTVVNLSANTCYAYRVSSYNGDGTLNTTSQPTSSDTTPPAIPTSVQKTGATTAGVTFGWTAVTGANSYNVYNGSDVFLSNVATNSVTIAATANTAKTIKVSAVSTANGEGGKSSSVTGYASANAPTSLTTSAKSTSSLTWAWSSGGAQKNFYASMPSPAANTGWQTAMSWLVNSLSENVNYTLNVKARNEDLEETTTASTTTYTSVAAPTVLLVNVAGTTQLDVTTTVANVATGSSGVYFENSTTGGTTGWIQSTTWNNSSLTPNTTYTYRAMARNGDAITTAWSGNFSATTLAAAPLAPIVGETKTSSSLSLKYKANGNPSTTTYQLFYSTTGTGTPTSNPGGWIQLSDWTAHADNDVVNVTSLSPNVTYYFATRAKNSAAVTTAWSAVGSSITLPADPNIVAGAHGHVTGTWYPAGTSSFDFLSNETVGIATYRYVWDTTAGTTIADCTAGTLWDLQSSATLDPVGSAPAASGQYYLHALSCNADDLAGGIAHYGPWRFDKDAPTITNNYTHDATLTNQTSTVTLSPVDTGGSAIASVKYCTGAACTPSTGTTLGSPYQLSYTTSQDTIVRYVTTDTAGNSSAIGTYRVILDVDAPVIATTDSVDTTDSADTDEVYHPGQTIRITSTATGAETGLTGEIRITSIATSYDSGWQSMTEVGAGAYRYDWNTSGRTAATDYVVETKMTDAATNVDNNGSNNGGADLTIILDSTNPTVDTFAITDTTSGSATYTNSATIAVALTESDTNGVAKWYLSESSTPPAASAFVLTARPTSYTLAATGDGNRSLYAWVLDSAGNVSNIASDSITLDTTIPTVSAFTTADPTSTTAGYTNQAAIDTVVTAADTSGSGVARYLINESATTPSIATMWAASATAPTSYTLTGGEGSRTTYAWVMDNAENITSATSAIILDTTLPTVTARQTKDLDGDGRIDAVRLTFDGAVKDASISAGHFTVTGYAGLAFNAAADADIANNAVAYLTFTEGTYDSDATPTVGYTAGTLTDLAGNLLANTSGTPTDGAAPAFVSSEMDDVDSDGLVDRVRVIYSEPVSSFSNDAANWSITSGPSGATLASVTAPGGTNTVVMTLTEGVGAPDTALGSFVVAYDTNGTVKDSTNNLATTFAATPPVDTARPVFVTRQTQDLDADGRMDAIRLVMSESVSDITIAASTFTLGAGNAPRAIDATYSGTTGSLTFVNGVSTGSTADDATYFVKLTEGTSIDTGATPTLAYTAGTLADLVTNTALTSGATATTDGVAPIPTTISIRDADSDGSVDTARITFSENILDSSITASDYAIAGILGTTVTTGTANDATIDVHITSEIAGTIAQDVTYTPGTTTDASGNLLAAVTSGTITEIDSSGPAIIFAGYDQNGTIGDATDDLLYLTFSESIDDSTLAISDFAVAGGGDFGAATISSGSGDDERITLNFGAGATNLTVGTSTIAFSGAGVVSDDVADSDGKNVSTQTTGVAVSGTVVVNEVMWMGTNTSANDEWIELRNMSASSVDISGWTIERAGTGGTTLTIPASSSIPGYGYFLISNFASGSSAILDSVTPDWVTTSIALADSGNGDLILKNGSITVDSVEGDTWPAGDSVNKYAMERHNSPGNGLTAGNWYSGNGRANLDAGTERASPGTTNIYDNLPPTIATASRYPAPNSLLPVDMPTISVNYSDDTPTSGIDTAGTSLTLDLNGDGTCETSTAATVSTTSLSYTPTTALPAGRIRACLTVADKAGNTATSSWDFWVDDFTMSITQTTADLGTISTDFAGETANDTEHTKITITTYGAGFSITGSAPAMTGPSSMPWHTNDTPTAGYGVAWRVKQALFDNSVTCGLIACSTSFGRYYNLNTVDWSGSNAVIASRAAYTGAELAASNTLKTYTFYVQQYVSPSATQAAGSYDQTVSYGIGLTY